MLLRFRFCTGSLALFAGSPCWARVWTHTGLSISFLLATFATCEYKETREETLEQLREFQSSLKKLAAGNLNLTDYFTSIQLVSNKLFYQLTDHFLLLVVLLLMFNFLKAIQATISEVLQTPEIILMFAKKQPEQLRLKVKSEKQVSFITCS